MTAFVTFSGHTATLRIRLTPRASKDALGGIHLDEKGDEWLKATVTAVPEKGRANESLIALLSKKLKARKGAFTLRSGETDRNKIFTVETDADMASALRSLAIPSAS